MPIPNTHRGRVWLWVRLTIGAGFLGIGFGYYLQIIGRLEMTPFMIFEFTVRGMLIGFFYWAVEIFMIQGPQGKHIRKMPYGPRLLVRVVFYLIAIEIGHLIGQAIYSPDNLWGFL